MPTIRHAVKTKILEYEPATDRLLVEEIVFEITQNGRESKTYKKSQHLIVIGRDAEADIIIENDESISRKHCQFYEECGKYYLEDLKSMNGTFYKEKRIAVQCIPPQGSFRVGQAEIRYWVKEQRKKIKKIEAREIPSHFIAETSEMQRLLFLVKAVAPSDASILLQGETGVGKEEVAKLLHAWSDRSHGPFIAINCATATDEVLENTLFGHEKGAFTGAADLKPGIFEEANNGTLFLDEVGEMPLSVQGSLLRVLETGMIRRLGRSKEETKVNVRIIAGTNRNLKQEVVGKKFREDLYYRLESITIRIPPLRERRGDMPKLIKNFVQAQNFAHQKIFTPEAMEVLMSFPWPGNIRQLKNGVLKLLFDPEIDNVIDVKDVLKLNAFEAQQITENCTTIPTLDEAHRQVIVDHIHAFPKDSIPALAERLKISRPTLTAMIRRYKIDMDAERTKGIKKSDF